jgi:PAS domain S-box-containing protein
MGDLLVSPALLTWGTRRWNSPAPRRVVEAMLLVVLALIVTRVAFGSAPEQAASGSLAYLMLPLMVWAAFRFGQPGASALSAFMLGAAVWHTSHGEGPFAAATGAGGLLLLQAFIATVAVTGLALGAAMEERRNAGEELVRQRFFLREVLDVNPSMVFAKNREGRFVLANEAVAGAYGTTVAELLGKTDADFAPAHQAEAFRRDDLEVMDTGREKVVPLEPLTDAQGRVRWLQTTKRPLGEPRGGAYERVLGVAVDITDRVSAEEALRGSEERYRALYEDTPSMYFTVNPEGTVLSVNRFGAAQLGYEPGELVGQPVLKVFFEPDRASASSHVGECVADPGRVFNWELRKVRKDGSLLWVKETARAVRSPDGKTVVLIVCEDITESRRAAEELQRERRLFMGGPVVVFRWVAGSGGRVEYVSSNVAAVFGYAPEDFLSGRVSYEDVIHPEDLARVKQELDDYQAAGVQRFEQHYRIVRSDGKVRWLDDYTVVALDESGRLTHHEGYVLDATHRRRTEEARRRAEADYRAIFENAVEGIFQSTPQGKLLAANPALARMLGFESPEQLIAETTDLSRQFYVEPERRAEFMRALDEQGGTVHGFEVQVRRRDGVVIWVSFSARAVRDESGAVRWYEGTAEEITERRRAEEALRRSETMSAMGLLVAGVAHEVRNPLYAITASLDAFEAGAGGGSPFSRIIGTLRREVGRMAGLMEELLEYGRATGGARALGRIEEAVAEAAALCADHASQRGVRLANAVGGGLPLVSMDRRRLVQVFHNLIENAIEHAPHHGAGVVELGSSLDSGPGGSWVVLAVSDNGPGFRAEDLPHLFEPFYSRRRGGTGLGLSIVQRIVVDHGGSVTANNRIGGGAEMVVRLPGAAE